MPAGRAYEIPDLLNAATASGRTVVAYPFEGAWQPIDRMEQLEDAARTASLNLS